MPPYFIHPRVNPVPERVLELGGHTQVDSRESRELSREQSLECDVTSHVCVKTNSKE